MYAWLWRRLPDPPLLRFALAGLTVAAVVVVLFAWVFPWIEPRLPFTEVTVQPQVSTSAGSSAAPSGASASAAPNGPSGPSGSSGSSGSAVASPR